MALELGIKRDLEGHKAPVYAVDVLHDLPKLSELEELILSGGYGLLPLLPEAYVVSHLLTELGKGLLLEVAVSC